MCRLSICFYKRIKQLGSYSDAVHVSFFFVFCVFFVFVFVFLFECEAECLSTCPFPACSIASVVKPNRLDLELGRQIGRPEIGSRVLASVDLPVNLGISC